MLIYCEYWLHLARLLYISYWNFSEASYKFLYNCIHLIISKKCVLHTECSVLCISAPFYLGICAHHRGACTHRGWAGMYYLV